MNITEIKITEKNHSLNGNLKTTFNPYNGVTNITSNNILIMENLESATATWAFNLVIIKSSIDTPITITQYPNIYINN